MDNIDFALLEFLYMKNGELNQNEFPVKFRDTTTLHDVTLSHTNNTMQQFFNNGFATVSFTKGNQYVFITQKGTELYNSEIERRFNEKTKIGLEFELLRGQVKYQTLNNQAIERQLSLMEQQTEAFATQTQIQKSMKEFTKFIVYLTVVLAVGTIVSAVLLMTQLLYQIRQGSGTWRVPYQLIAIPIFLVLLTILALRKTKLVQELILILKGGD